MDASSADAFFSIFLLRAARGGDKTIPEGEMN